MIQTCLHLLLHRWLFHWWLQHRRADTSSSSILLDTSLIVTFKAPGTTRVLLASVVTFTVLAHTAGSVEVLASQVLFASFGLTASPGEAGLLKAALLLLTFVAIVYDTKKTNWKNIRRTRFFPNRLSHFFTWRSRSCWFPPGIHHSQSN